MTPHSHRQAGTFFFFFLIPSNTPICILNVSRKWLLSSAAVTGFGRQEEMSVYVTQTKCTSSQISPCSMCYKVLQHRWGARIHVRQLWTGFNTQIRCETLGTTICWNNSMMKKKENCFFFFFYLLEKTALLIIILQNDCITVHHRPRW